MEVAASAVIVDLAGNVIRLVVPDLAPCLVRTEARTVLAILDVGAQGRLLGVELGETYVRVMDPPPGGDAHARSAEVEVAIDLGEHPVLRIPRRGPSYEITYPSGNQCWQVTAAGEKVIQLCATTADAPEALRAGRGSGKGDR